MLYQQLAGKLDPQNPVRIAVIGAGRFGSGVVRHSAYVPAIRVCAIADADVETARSAYLRSGIAQQRIAVCANSSQVQAAMAQGRYVVTEDAAMLFDQQFDVLVEATGIPEAGALHAQQAIAHGKHVAMVTKEADAAVGPMLKYLADRAGLVYTAVDGDQHGMLMGLVCWARSIGLDILCGGKALDGELLLDTSAATIRHYGDRIDLSPAQLARVSPRALTDPAQAIVDDRAAALGDHAGAQPWDLVELTIAANGTGLAPDVPQTHCPSCWTTEIPELLCPREMGGLLRCGGAIDAVQIIRQAHDASFGGGVFIVIGTHGEALQEMVQGKGMICHRGGGSALLMLPHHLLGVEAIGSILAAALLHIPTGATEYLPRYDVTYRAKRRLKAGEKVGHDHSPELTARIVPATRLAEGAPLPAGLARGNVLLRDVPEGEIITAGMVQRPTNSVLWSLRGEMEKQFNLT